MKLLLIGEDVSFASAMRSTMGLLMGVLVQWVAHGMEAERELRDPTYGYVVIELGLVGRDGDATVSNMRAAGIEAPVVVVAEGEQVQHRIRVLDLGADDFVVKPVHLAELAARLRAVRRRCGNDGPGTAELRHGKLSLVPASRSVTHGGKHVPVTHAEFCVLETLVRRRGKVLSREELEAARDSHRGDGAGNPVEVHIHHLRRKLGPDLIRTVRGIGYTIGLTA